MPRESSTTVVAILPKGTTVEDSLAIKFTTGSGGRAKRSSTSKVVEGTEVKFAIIV